jgi:hypothetical protein
VAQVFSLPVYYISSLLDDQFLYNCLPQSDTEWIIDLDNIDTTYVLSPFPYTILGHVPVKLLQIGTEYLDRRDLVAVTHISPTLKAHAERQLYQYIETYRCSLNSDKVRGPDLPQAQTGHSRTRGGNNRAPGGSYRARRPGNLRVRERAILLYPLYKTLSIGSDLCELVKSASLTASDHQSSILVPSTSVFPGGVPFTPNLYIDMSELTIAGALLQHLKVIERLHVRHYEEVSMYSDDHGHPTDNCLAALFPGFYDNTAHLMPFTGLQKLIRRSNDSECALETLHF